MRTSALLESWRRRTSTRRSSISRGHMRMRSNRLQCRVRDAFEFAATIFAVFSLDCAPSGATFDPWCRSRHHARRAEIHARERRLGDRRRVGKRRDQVAHSDDREPARCLATPWNSAQHAPADCTRRTSPAIPGNSRALSDFLRARCAGAAPPHAARTPVPRRMYLLNPLPVS